MGGSGANFRHDHSRFEGGGDGLRLVLVAAISIAFLGQMSHNRHSGGWEAPFRHSYYNILFSMLYMVRTAVVLQQ